MNNEKNVDKTNEGLEKYPLSLCCMYFTMIVDKKYVIIL